MVTEVWQAGFHMRELDQRLGRDGDGGKVIHLQGKLLHIDLTFRFWLQVGMTVKKVK